MNRILLMVVLAVTLIAALGTSAGAGRVSSFPLQLKVQELGPLSGATYELWVVDGNRKLSAGKFNVSRAGRPPGASPLRLTPRARTRSPSRSSPYATGALRLRPQWSWPESRARDRRPSASRSIYAGSQGPFFSPRQLTAHSPTRPPASGSSKSARRKCVPRCGSRRCRGQAGSGRGGQSSRRRR